MKPRTRPPAHQAGNAQTVVAGRDAAHHGGEIRRVAEEGLPRLPSIPNYKRWGRARKAKAKPMPPAKRLSDEGRARAPEAKTGGAPSAAGLSIATNIHPFTGEAIDTVSRPPAQTARHCVAAMAA